MLAGHMVHQCFIMKGECMCIAGIMCHTRVVFVHHRLVYFDSMQFKYMYATHCLSILLTAWGHILNNCLFIHDHKSTILGRLAGRVIT